jgi:hypothetical protein
MSHKRHSHQSHLTVAQSGDEHMRKVSVTDTVRVSIGLAKWLVVHAIGAHGPVKVQIVQMTRAINGASLCCINVRYFARLQSDQCSSAAAGWFSCFYLQDLILGHAFVGGEREGQVKLFSLLRVVVSASEQHSHSRTSRRLPIFFWNPSV